MKYAKLIGTGSYLPSAVMTNQDFEKIVDTSAEWIVSRTGIKRRHVAAKEETTSSMAEIAAREALKIAKLDAQDIDLIIVATCTAENFFPSTACLLQGRLKIKNCIAFDISAACTGFVYAASIADQYIRSGMVKNVLVVGSEIFTKVIDWQDRNTCVLFGDGAGAAVFQAADEPGIIASKLYSSADKQEVLTLPTTIYGEKSLVAMQGRELFKVAVKGMSEAVKELLAENEIQIAQVDWVIPHQANSRIIDAVSQRLGLIKERVILTVSDHANTSGASIPLALDDAYKKGLIKPGQLVLLAAFGGGLTWGSMLIKV
jgi:3-oxoacyl-[acyl-carrier-protein] synthase III